MQCRGPGFNPWVRKILWRREWQSTPVFLPGESHGQRGLVGYSPCGHKESDTTEQLTLHYYPLQYSCLKNSRNGQRNLAGYSPRKDSAHGVTKSQTQLSDFHFLIRDLKAVKCPRLWNWGKGYVEVFCTILATFL